MGQIQVASTGCGAGDWTWGVDIRVNGDWDLVDCRWAGCEERAGLAAVLRDLERPVFRGLGYKVILGDDFRKPA